MSILNCTSGLVVEFDLSEDSKQGQQVFLIRVVAWGACQGNLFQGSLVAPCYYNHTVYESSRESVLLGTRLS